MSTLKARFDEAQARELLRPQYGEVGAITPLRGGEASQAFAFSARGAALVLRVNHQAGYERDARATRLAAGQGVPAPEIAALGEDGGYYWAVSTRVPGQILQVLPREAVRDLVPQPVDTLLRIHALDYGDSSGYGPLDAAGNGRYPSWRAYLEDFEFRGDFIDWPRVLREIEGRQRALIERCRAEARALLPACPEERAFNHGDYSLDNLLADGGRITGVIDWSNCLYGDPLRDVAAVDFWFPDLGFGAAYLARRPLDAAPRRLACYTLLLAAFALGFFQHTGQTQIGASIVPTVERALRDLPR